MEDFQLNEQYKKFWKHVSLGKKDETLIVLKGHLLLEDILREFCAAQVKNKDALEQAKLSFMQILHLTKAFHELKIQDWILGGLNNVNTLRNMLAHNLEPERYIKKREEFINHIRSSMTDASIYEDLSLAHEHLAVSIFFLYSGLSANLRFKPKGLLVAALSGAYPEKSSTNRKK